MENNKKIDLEIGEHYSLKDRLIANSKFKECAEMNHTSLLHGEKDLVIGICGVKRNNFALILNLTIIVAVLYIVATGITMGANQPPIPDFVYNSFVYQNLGITAGFILAVFTMVVLLNRSSRFHDQMDIKICDISESNIYTLPVKKYNQIMIEDCFLKILTKCEDKEKRVEVLKEIFTSCRVNDKDVLNIERVEPIFLNNFRINKETITLYNKLFIVYPLFVLFFSLMGLYDTKMDIWWFFLLIYVIAISIYFGLIIYSKKNNYEVIRVYEKDNDSIIKNYKEINFTLSNYSLLKLNEVLGIVYFKEKEDELESAKNRHSMNSSIKILGALVIIYGLFKVVLISLNPYLPSIIRYINNYQ